MFLLNAFHIYLYLTKYVLMNRWKVLIYAAKVKFMMLLGPLQLKIHSSSSAAFGFLSAVSSRFAWI